MTGPGATRNGRKVQAAVGKSVHATPAGPGPGNGAANNSINEGLALTTLPHHLGEELHGHVLEEAFTVGKELFLIFNSSPDCSNEATDTDIAVRLHFGMNGSLNVRKVKAIDLDKKPTGVAPWKRNNTPTLRLYFSNDVVPGRSDNSTYTVVETWETTVSYPVSAANSRNKFIDHTSRDVCSTLFNAQDVFTSIRQSGNNLIISDALLNQDICPGVGNIIKIESLHQGKIDPRRVVSSLTDVELRRLIRHTRKYSMDWLKSGRANPKHVYNQTTCGTCQGMSVKMQKIGGLSSSGNNAQTSGKGHAFMSRVTFWCTSCQPLTTSEGNAQSLQPQFDHPASMDNSAGTRQALLSTANNSNRPQTQCPQHGTRSIKLCRVRKGTQNTLRIFFTCTKKGCQYFCWADSQFSNCKCGKKAILRVSKTERSGGRWFLCCASGDRSNQNSNSSNGCGHFEWAKDEHLGHMRSLLTPLL